MKKILTATLSIVLAISMLTACAPKEEIAKNGETAKNVNKVVTDYTTEGKVTQLVGDPNATGELVISSSSVVSSSDGSVLNDLLNNASNKFRELYPNVKLTVERGNNGLAVSEYKQKLSTQIMSGSGPDIFFVSDSDMDVNKMMESGSLANMYEFFENDKNFNIDDYNATVFCSGQPSKSQYMMPITYYIPLFLTTETVIQNSGLDLSKMNDYLSFMQEVDKTAQKNHFKSWWYPKFSGMDLFDYDNATVNLDTPEVRSIYELLKSHNKKYSDEETPEIFNPSKLFQDKLTLYRSMTYLSLFTAFDTFVLNSKGEEKPVMFTWKNINGKITPDSTETVAVNGSSKNKQNAYNFIKILMNPDITVSADYLNSNIPISKQGFEMVVKKFVELSGNVHKNTLEASEEFVKQYKTLLSEVSEIDWNSNANSLLQQEMTPYFKGEKSYEDCIKSAKEKLEIYISE